MKIRYALLPAVLALILSLPVLGQPRDGDPAKNDMKKRDMSDRMGKPTVDATVEGLHIQVWLMTQNEHKEMMRGNMGQRMVPDNKEGTMGQMETKDTVAGMGRDMNVTKIESWRKGEGRHVMKLERLGKREDVHAMKPDSARTRDDIKVMRHENMEANKAVMDSMMAGTHHIGLDVTDAASGKEVANASVTVLIVSPSKKNASVQLKPMMRHFAGALTLEEKGAYQFAVSVNAGGVSKTTRFEYAVK